MGTVYRLLKFRWEEIRSTLFFEAMTLAYLGDMRQLTKWNLRYGDTILSSFAFAIHKKE